MMTMTVTLADVDERKDVDDVTTKNGITMTVADIDNDDGDGGVT